MRARTCWSLLTLAMLVAGCGARPANGSESPGDSLATERVEESSAGFRWSDFEVSLGFGGWLPVARLNEQADLGGNVEAALGYRMTDRLCIGGGIKSGGFLPPNFLQWVQAVPYGAPEITRTVTQLTGYASYVFLRRPWSGFMKEHHPGGTVPRGSGVYGKAQAGTYRMRLKIGTPHDREDSKTAFGFGLGVGYQETTLLKSRVVGRVGGFLEGMYHHMTVEDPEGFVMWPPGKNNADFLALQAGFVICFGPS